MEEKHAHIIFMENWFREVWTDENPDAVARGFTEGGNAKGLGNRPVVGPEEFQGFQKALLGLLKEISVTIDDHICDDDRCSLVCTVFAKCRTSGKPVEITGSCFLKFAGGKIAHCENHFEFLDLYEQLGFLPQNTFGKALGGEKIA